MKDYLVLALIVLVASTSALMPQRTTEIAKPRADSTDYRLPTSVVPSHYLLILEATLDSNFFYGYVEIDVTVTEETDNITLHSVRLNNNIMVTKGDTEVIIKDKGNDGTKEFYIIYFNETLSTGEYQIKINYTGIWNTELQGFYKSSYTNAAGEERVLGTTQFEPTDARKAFPCFDEPALKANFTIQIVRPTDYNSVSNMPLKETVTMSDSTEMDIFETSPKMSTYLVAFIVSDYKYVEEENQRVYSRPDYIEYGDANFALSVGVPCLKALANYTGVPYSLTKMYQISIPDFSAGAMENWGLVTYRESALIFNKSTTTTSSKQGIEVVISHEYTHQWFGDLVSPEWWNYLWLNEGFASYLQYHIGAAVKPTWRLIEQMVVANTYSAFAADALESTRPMTFDAGSPTEINALFDIIAYQKSGAVLKMLSNAISEDAFRSGIKRYLEARQFKEANSGHLWNNIQVALDEEYPNALPENLTVPLIMESWETQSGYPVINAIRDYSTYKVTLSQERFFLEKTVNDDDSAWYVPINYATKANPDFSDTTASHWLLPDANLTITIGLTSNQWFLVNKQVAGYYRVNYDEANWKLLASYLNTTSYTNISPLNRAQLIYDAFTFARSGRLSYKVALELTNYLHRETDYIPLYAFFNVIAYFNMAFAGATNYTLFEARLARIYNAAIIELDVKEKEGSDDDTEHVNNLNRVNVIQLACHFGNARCRRLTTARLSDIDSISVDLQSPVLCGGLRGANQTVWNAVYQRSLTETNELLKSRLTSALGCSEDESILDAYVLNALNEGKSLFTNIYETGNFGIKYVFNYLVKNLNNVHEKLGDSATGNAITGVASFLTTQDKLDQLLELNQTATPSLHSYFATAISTVEANIQSASPHLEDVTSWIAYRLSDYGDIDDDDDDENDDDDDDDDDGNDDDDDDDNGNDDDDDDDDGSGDGDGDDSGAMTATSTVTTLLLILTSIIFLR